MAKFYTVCSACTFVICELLCDVILFIMYCILSLSRELDDITYEKLSDETLDELAEFFEDLGDSGLCPAEYDSSFAVSALTVYKSKLKGVRHTVFLLDPNL